jgi:lipoate-protein ligase B
MVNSSRKRLLRIDLGQTGYDETRLLQKSMVLLRHEGKIPDCLVFAEHEPTITMGRGTTLENLLVTPEFLGEKGIGLFEVERGGDITFHGPGQTVLYPIIDLNLRGRDLHQYLRDLEKLVMVTLGEFELEAGTKSGLTGVWVGDKKLAAIGVAVSHWITYHGLALNVTTDLKYFRLINPCGIIDYSVGSMAEILGRTISLQQVNDSLARNFATLFDYDIEAIQDGAQFIGDLADGRII